MITFAFTPNQRRSTPYRLDLLSFHLQFGLVDGGFALNTSRLGARLRFSLRRSGALDSSTVTRSVCVTGHTGGYWWSQ